MRVSQVDLRKHPREVSRAQLDRLRHLAKRQLVFNLGVYELFDPAQAGGTSPASVRLHRTALHCITVD